MEREHPIHRAPSRHPLPLHWRAFIARTGLPSPGRTRPTLELLETVLRAYSTIPYENATQLIVAHQQGPQPRWPEVLIEEHLKLGTGGTCYGLSFACSELLELYGFELALHRGWVGDRLWDTKRLSRGNHGALTLRVGRTHYLVDPGMLMTVPLEIGPRGEQRRNFRAREAEIMTEVDGEGRLHVMRRVARGYTRLCWFELEPLSRQEYEAEWRMAFVAPLLPANYLFLNRVIGGALWTACDRILTRRDGLSVVSRTASLQELAWRWRMPEELLRRAWKYTPDARIGCRIRTAANRALHVLTRRLSPDRPPD